MPTLIVGLGDLRIALLMPIAELVQVLLDSLLVRIHDELVFTCEKIRVFNLFGAMERSVSKTAMLILYADNGHSRQSKYM